MQDQKAEADAPQAHHGVAESFSGPRLVSSTARRHSISTSLLFTLVVKLALSDQFLRISYAFADRRWSALMNRRVTTVIIAATALCLGVVSAHAGPCSSEIARFEQAVRQSAGNPGAGPMAPQSIGAQLDRQPTPASIRRAEQQAKATFAATLARAKRLDKQGNRTGCTRALTAAKRMYNLQ
jgi:hypothetical protein